MAVNKTVYALSMMTPDFPFWAGTFTRQLQLCRRAAAGTVHQMELLFGPWIAPGLLAQQDEGSHSRSRRWNLRLVFWTFLWQVAQAGSACREAIRQAQALCLACGLVPPPGTTSPYCQARANLPLERLDQIHRRIVDEADKIVGSGQRWCGRRVLTADGTTVTAPDTPDNQKVFPQQSVQRPGCGFPIIRIVALLNLATGMLVAWATGNWFDHELPLFHSLWDYLKAGDVLLADRGFCNWALLAQCQLRKVDAVFRLKGSRRGDFRRGRRLSRNERLVHWPKPVEPAWTVSPSLWAQFPEVLTLRLVRCHLNLPGFRTRQIILVTTLLDSHAFPPDQLGQLYYRRWFMELSLRHLKMTLQMDQLSCKTPANLEREIRMHFLVHNLVRRLMLEAAKRHHVPLARMSFTGSLAAARRFAEVLLQTRSSRQRRRLLDQLLGALAQDQVPDRPGRREPRAVKRRPKPYPLLMNHRHRFLEIPHQNKYRKKSRS
jgi:DDE family transposase